MKAAEISNKGKKMSIPSLRPFPLMDGLSQGGQRAQAQEGFLFPTEEERMGNIEDLLSLAQ